MADNMIGRVLNNRYRLIRRLGSGGMGRVYLAEDLTLPRQVAIKVLADQFTTDRDFVRRFRGEAEVMSQLFDHPNIAPIFDLGQDQDEPFIVMQYVAGQSLRDLLLATPSEALPVGTVAQIGAQVAAALARAHQLGVVHRDVKPENILLRAADGVALLVDFGIAKRGEGGRHSSTRLGTPVYMAPERARGGTATPQSDIYSLGVMLYEMLAGRVPFEGEDDWGTLYMHVHDTPVRPRSLNPAIPEWLDAIVLRALQKDPAARFASAEELSAALRSGMSATEAPARATAVLAETPVPAAAGVLDARAQPAAVLIELDENRARVISDTDTLVTPYAPYLSVVRKLIRLAAIPATLLVLFICFVWMALAAGLMPRSNDDQADSGSPAARGTSGAPGAAVAGGEDLVATPDSGSGSGGRTDGPELAATSIPTLVARPTDVALALATTEVPASTAAQTATPVEPGDSLTATALTAAEETSTALAAAGRTADAVATAGAATTASALTAAAETHTAVLASLAATATAQQQAADTRIAATNTALALAVEAANKQATANVATTTALAIAQAAAEASMVDATSTANAAATRKAGETATAAVETRQAAAVAATNTAVTAAAEAARYATATTLAEAVAAQTAEVQRQHAAAATTEAALLARQATHTAAASETAAAISATSAALTRTADEVATREAAAAATAASQSAARATAAAAARPPTRIPTYGVVAQGVAINAWASPGVCALYFYLFGGVEKTFVFRTQESVEVGNFNGTLSCWQTLPAPLDIGFNHPFADVPEVLQAGVTFAGEIAPVPRSDFYCRGLCWVYSEADRTMTWRGPTDGYEDIFQEQQSPHLARIQAGYMAIIGPLSVPGSIEACVLEIDGVQVKDACDGNPVRAQTGVTMRITSANLEVGGFRWTPDPGFGWRRGQ